MSRLSPRNVSWSLSSPVISRSVCQFTCHRTSSKANQLETEIDKPRPSLVCYYIHHHRLISKRSREYHIAVRFSSKRPSSLTMEQSRDRLSRSVSLSIYPRVSFIVNKLRDMLSSSRLIDRWWLLLLFFCASRKGKFENSNKKQKRTRNFISMHTRWTCTSVRGQDKCVVQSWME